MPSKLTSEAMTLRLIITGSRILIWPADHHISELLKRQRVALTKPYATATSSAHLEKR